MSEPKVCQCPTKNPRRCRGLYQSDSEPCDCCETCRAVCNQAAIEEGEELRAAKEEAYRKAGRL